MLQVLHTMFLFISPSLMLPFSATACNKGEGSKQVTFGNTEGLCCELRAPSIPYPTRSLFYTRKALLVELYK